MSKNRRHVTFLLFEIKSQLLSFIRLKTLVFTTLTRVFASVIFDKKLDNESLIVRLAMIFGGVSSQLSFVKDEINKKQKQQEEKKDDNIVVEHQVMMQ